MVGVTVRALLVLLAERLIVQDRVGGLRISMRIVLDQQLSACSKPSASPLSASSAGASSGI